MHIPSLRLKGMIIINNEYLAIYDGIILNEIEENNDLKLNQLSSKLKCSKSIIVSRIDDLIDKGYIEIFQNNFVLTQKGKSAKIPCEIFSYDTDNDRLSGETDMYDWQKIYIPPEGIFD